MLTIRPKVKLDKNERIEKDRIAALELENFLEVQEFLFEYSNFNSNKVIKLFLVANIHISTEPKLDSLRWILARALYFKSLRLHKESLSSINFAEQCGAEPGLVRRMRMEVKGRQSNEYQSSLWEFFKLSFVANEKIPSLASCLKLEENEEFGKHIVTTRSLEAGDIVAITEPFFKSFCHAAIGYRCSYCQRSNNMDLFDCLRCTQGKFCNC